MSLKFLLNLLVFSLVMMAALLNAEPIRDLKDAWQKHKVAYYYNLYDFPILILFSKLYICVCFSV